MKTLVVIALAIFKDGKILLGRSWKEENLFKFIGGKPEEGESDIECLKREVGEEINVDLVEDSIKFLKEFEGPAYNHPDLIIKVKLYKGEIIGEPVPSNEIVEVKYFDSSINPDLVLGVSRRFIPFLKQEGYLN